MDSTSIVECTVQVQHVIFSDPTQGFCIFKASPENGNLPESFVAKGHVGNINPGNKLLLWGYWVQHPKFGPQVQVTRFQVPEMDNEEILNFLSSGFIKGIGPALARSIVDTFGRETAHIFEHDPQRLLQINGLGPRKIEGIIESWQEHSAHRKAIVKLQEWGIGPAKVQKILQRFEPEQAISIIQENPYILAREIEGIGFLTADHIAAATGIKTDSPERLQAGLIYTLQEALNRAGHCYLSETELMHRALKLLFPQQSNAKAKQKALADVIDELCAADICVREEGCLFLLEIQATETRIAKNIDRLCLETKNFPFDPSAMIACFEDEECIKLDSKQKEAVQSSLMNKLSIVTGGPGTGKTTIVKTILRLARQAGISKIGLIAPTGRAAKRLEEASAYEASTVHRYLGYNPQEGFAYHSENRVQAELIICDEASMLDIFLTRALLEALPAQTRMILVGDVHQLPSVGPGNVLRDLIRSNQLPVVELTQIHRQSEDSWISRNAHAVKDGQVLDINLKGARDFVWYGITGQEPEQTAHNIQEKILDIVRDLFKINSAEQQIQILTPMHKTPIGVRELNKRLRDLFNPWGEEIMLGNRTFRLGDRVMQLKNDYEKEIFNGDQGLVCELSAETGEIRVDFAGNIAEYTPLELDDIILSYACTIHKSQGSEFPVVIIPVCLAHYIMLQRNLIYTAITRAKDLCVLVGEHKALEIAVQNQKPILRNTRLAERLSGLTDSQLLLARQSRKG